MELNYERDEQRLGQRAYGIKKKRLQLKDLHEFLRHPDHAASNKQLVIIKEWLISPRSIATVESTGLSRHVCETLRKKEPLEPALELLLDLVDDFPSEQCQAVIGQHEHNMLGGQYDAIVPDQTKFDAQLKRILANPEYHQHLKRIDDLFDLKSREAFNGLIVCPLQSHRTNGPDDFDWSSDKAKFDRVFYSFCRRYDLYGLEYGKPLLFKVKVLTTPLGLTIHYPKWMSMDVWRDLSHGEIMKIHKAYGADRQGPKLSIGKLEREELALRVWEADAYCKEKKMVGDERHQFIIKECDLSPDTCARTIRRFLKLARELLAKEKTLKPKTDTPAPANDPHQDIKLARTRANYLALSPEAREEFRKWMAAV